MTDQPDILPLLEASNLKWLRKNTILLTKHGSQAYGTSTPTSDTDFKGICIEPPEFLLGMSQGFFQAEYHKPDAVIYSLRKFMKLAADCNPSIIEVLFTDESDWVIGSPHWSVDSDEAWALKQLMAFRDSFLSRKARWTFAGYAAAQLKRIRTHHRWLTKPPDHKPTRTEYDLPERTVIPFDQLLAAESSIRKEMDALYNLDLDLDDAGNVRLKEGLAALKHRVTALIAGSQDPTFHVVGASLGFDTNFLLLLEHERAYKNAGIEWDQYQEWKRTRNADRAALEAKFGYDTKHAMHLVRLMRMGREIMEGKGVIVKRPDAQELLAIRGGAWSYESLVSWAEDMEQTLEALYETSPLPRAPDHPALERLCLSIYEDYHYGVFRTIKKP